ncbi:hypothetical protein [Acinetobacter baumannii]|uniref:hypothetical protein n=1 Tax=Acinetobacter baumannii TaxID=470 RepID=UPI0024B69CFC|nr:hypothetical protein [Acinetobacter baumannii]MDI9759674.1 hypothetical protein [Acinetobacter baumannii]
MSVGLNEILNFSIILLLIFALFKVRQESKRINELNKRLSEIEIRLVIRAEDRLTKLEQEVFFQNKTNLKTEV